MQNEIIKEITAKNPWKMLLKFRYFQTTITILNYIHGEIMRRLNSGKCLLPLFLVSFVLLSPKVRTLL
jgi:hypothetical protein